MSLNRKPSTGQCVLTTTGKQPVWFDDLIDELLSEDVFGALDAPDFIPAGSHVVVGYSILSRAVRRDGRPSPF